MKIERLVAMANDIAAFFANEKDPNVAAEQVASHIKRYWEARMRKELAAHVRMGAAGMSDLARRAIERLEADIASGDARAGAA
jgi:formate dehydrogenase subunit delta